MNFGNLKDTPVALASLTGDYSDSAADSVRTKRVRRIISARESAKAYSLRFKEFLFGSPASLPSDSIITFVSNSAYKGIFKVLILAVASLVAVTTFKNVDDIPFCGHVNRRTDYKVSASSGKSSDSESIICPAAHLLKKTLDVYGNIDWPKYVDTAKLATYDESINDYYGSIFGRCGMTKNLVLDILESIAQRRVPNVGADFSPKVQYGPELMINCMRDSGYSDRAESIMTSLGLLSSVSKADYDQMFLTNPEKSNICVGLYVNGTTRDEPISYVYERDMRRLGKSSVTDYLEAYVVAYQWTALVLVFIVCSLNILPIVLRVLKDRKGTDIGWAKPVIMSLAPPLALLIIYMVFYFSLNAGSISTQLSYLLSSDGDSFCIAGLEDPYSLDTEIASCLSRCESVISTCDYNNTRQLESECQKALKCPASCRAQGLETVSPELFDSVSIFSVLIKTSYDPTYLIIALVLTFSYDAFIPESWISATRPTSVLVSDFLVAYSSAFKKHMAPLYAGLTFQVILFTIYSDATPRTAGIVIFCCISGMAFSAAFGLKNIGRRLPISTIGDDKPT